MNFIYFLLIFSTTKQSVHNSRSIVHPCLLERLHTQMDKDLIKFLKKRTDKQEISVTKSQAYYMIHTHQEQYGMHQTNPTWVRLEISFLFFSFSQQPTGASTALKWKRVELIFVYKNYRIIVTQSQAYYTIQT